MVNINNRQLIFARELRGYNQTELSNSIKGLAQSNLSKFEKGFGVLSEDVQLRIIEFLEFPLEFFDKKINFTIENANYRKRSTINKTEVQKFENKCKLVGYSIDELSESIEWPEFKLSQLDVDNGYEPEEVAVYARKSLNLGKREPVKDIFKLLESKGIIIYEINEFEKFDGVSFMSDKGFPVIIVNKNISNDRKRFTLAHELGHLLMHNGFPISSFRDKESEANRFAGEFLMPKEDIYRDLKYLKMSQLYDLKKYWLTSMSSIIRRAKDLGCMDENRYRYFMIEMSRNGNLKEEPVSVNIDKPKSLSYAFNLMKDELHYTNNDLSKYLSLPTDIINSMFFSEKTKLRIA